MRLGLGLHINRRRRPPQSFSGPLDGLSGIDSAYSLRRLRSAYSGPLLRVRRSTDNAERDIGATEAGHLDTTALLAFCGAGSGFVVTWHDQSGNARHATQSTAANQPRIVNAGALEANPNGRPKLVFDGTNDALLGPSFATTQPVFVLSSSRWSGTGQWRPYMLSNNISLGDVPRIYLSGGNFQAFAGNGAVLTAQRTTAINVGVLYQGATSRETLDGADTSISNPGAANGTGIIIGNAVVYHTGDVMGVVVFSTIPDQTKRLELVAGSVAYYGSN